MKFVPIRNIWLGFGTDLDPDTGSIFPKCCGWIMFTEFIGGVGLGYRLGTFDYILDNWRLVYVCVYMASKPHNSVGPNFAWRHRWLLRRLLSKIKKNFEHDLQSNSKKFYSNLKLSPSKCYNAGAPRISTTVPVNHNKMFTCSKNQSNARQKL